MFPSSPKYLLIFLIAVSSSSWVWCFGTPPPRIFLDFPLFFLPHPQWFPWILLHFSESTPKDFLGFSFIFPTQPLENLLPVAMKFYSRDEDFLWFCFMFPTPPPRIFLDFPVFFPPHPQRFSWILVHFPTPPPRIFCWIFKDFLGSGVSGPPGGWFLYAFSRVSGFLGFLDPQSRHFSDHSLSAPLLSSSSL